VLRNHYVSQIESANTFSLKVVEVLQAVSKKKGVNFHLFFTGWIQQVTTFTTEYLRWKEIFFLKITITNIVVIFTY
jgi:hypothetical protein